MQNKTDSRVAGPVKGVDGRKPPAHAGSYMFVPSILIFLIVQVAAFIFPLLISVSAPAAAGLLVYEDFDYERRQWSIGSIEADGIAGLDGGIGFGGPWYSTGSLRAGITGGPEDFTGGSDSGARTAPLGYTDAFGNRLAVSGNQLRTAFGNNSWDRRALAAPVGAPGETVWISFLAQAHGLATASPRYAFVELLDIDGNRLWIGKVAPFTSGYWGAQAPDHPEGSLAVEAEGFPMDAQTFFLVRVEVPESSADATRIEIWMNPSNLVHEGALGPPAIQLETPMGSFTEIGVAGRYSTDFDELRIGTNFDSVTPVSRTLPDGVSVAIAREEFGVVLSWPDLGTGGFMPYVSPDLKDWSPLFSAVEQREGQRNILLSGGWDRRFFRLQPLPPVLPRPRLVNLENVGWDPVAVVDGLVYYERHFDDLFGDPQVAQMLALDLDHPGLRLELTATDVWGLTRVPIPDLAGHAGALAAINGGFAPARTHPEVGYGIMKFRGTVWPFVNDPDFHESAESLGRNALGIDAEGNWHFASRGEEGWEMGARWPDDWPEVTDAMAGGSHIVRDGKIHPLIVAETTAGAYIEHTGLNRRTFNRHPRTAIGITDDRIAVLLTVAGRFPGIAAGMTLRETAELMLFAGCRDALELDGGGSSTMWIRDEPFGGVVNYPTDNGEFDHEGVRSLRLAVLIMEEEQ